MKDEKLTSFNLVGGTALALFMGHRKSIDLDLFSQQAFDVTTLADHLMSAYNFEFQNPEQKSNATLIGYINGIKIDCIRYDYSQVKPVRISDGIRLCSMHDIAAMKLTAISQNGTRLKDFIDVAFLSAKMPLKEMLDAFEAKYPNTNKLSAVKGLVYFNDIDFSTKIDLIDGIFKWKEIEKRLNEMIKYPNRTFLAYPVTNERKAGIGFKK
jgi:hypothetical protein